MDNEPNKKEHIFLENTKVILENVSYEFFEENRYKITDFMLNKEEYSGICNNGFIKIHSNKCKAYWLCQNEIEHTSKDWKFHISVNNQDLKKAWNLISKIFIEIKCKTGMKVYYLKENSTSAIGREITLYIFKYDKIYDNSEIRACFDFDYCDEHSENFWIEFVLKIESTLKANKIKSNGLAKGDLKIGEYVSLRNEAYVKIGKELVYPPDNYGWNSVGHELPFNIEKFVLKNFLLEKIFMQKLKFFYFLSIIILIFAVRNFM